MLTEIRLQNFKCFKDMVPVPTGKINLFTGINGRGKSTALQALLLMRQSPEHSRTTNQLIFNGSCVELGSFNDIRNSDVSQSDPIELGFRFEEDTINLELHYKFIENNQDSMVANIEKLTCESQGHVEGHDMTFRFSVPSNDKSRLTWHNLLPTGEDEDGNPINELNIVDAYTEFTKTHYISADRIGPQDFYPKQSFSEFPNVGRRGEYTANVLSKKKNDLVDDALCLDTGETHTVIDQTAAWLSAIFDGGKIDIKSLEANIVLMTLNAEDSTQLYKPINVGFGYSYALPIIVSGLIAKAGEILIVENPEAHLHPAAQAQITKFLAKVSAYGVQVFIESHSDHILNGLRVAILDEIISSQDLNILYFQRDKDLKIIKILVGDDGSIESWPDGFFDQTDKDFKRLFGF